MWTTASVRRRRRKALFPAIFVAALALLPAAAIGAQPASDPARGGGQPADRPSPAQAGDALPPTEADEPDSAIEPDPSDPLPPTGIEAELERMRPGTAIKRKFDEIAAKTNIRLGFASTFLFQQATAGPGERSAGGGDLDLLAKWTAIGAGTEDTGILAFAGEYRFQIGDQAPAALGSEIGTLLPTTNAFSERPPVVKELYWDQRLLGDRFRYVAGRVDPENLFGGHRLQSANLYFLNKAFSSNPAVAYPGPGFAAAAQIKPVSWLYIDGGINDANGKATMGNFEGFIEDKEFLTFGEAALTPTIDGLGAGRYRVAIWHIDARDEAGAPSDQGVTISLDQDFGESVTAFARYSHADGDVTNVTNSVQGGVGIRGLFAEEDMLGLAAAWSDPKADGLRDETVIEVFERLQVTESAQLMFGVQTIFDPSNAPDDDVLGVFSVRLRVAF
ncbi:MAG: carbohydrate porin [Phycisphaerales bacterium JB039]